MSVIGTIQPGVLKRLLTRETRESGLLARLLLAMPPEVPRQWTEAEVEESLVNQFEDSLRGLRRLGFNADQRGRNRPHRVTLSAEAKGVFVAFFNRNGMRTFEVTEDEAAARSKMEAYALRFALLFHCVRYVGAVEHPDVVGAADMAAAVRLTEWFIAETARVYQMLGETEVEEADRKLVDVVRRLAAKTPSGLVSSRDIQRSNPQKYPNAQAAEATLDRVVQLGLGEWEGVPSGLRGRPPSRAVRIIQQQPDTTT